MIIPIKVTVPATNAKHSGVTGPMSSVNEHNGRPSHPSNASAEHNVRPSHLSSASAEYNVRPSHLSSASVQCKGKTAQIHSANETGAKTAAKIVAIGQMTENANNALSGLNAPNVQTVHSVQTAHNALAALTERNVQIAHAATITTAIIVHKDALIGQINVSTDAMIDPKDGVRRVAIIGIGIVTLDAARVETIVVSAITGHSGARIIVGTGLITARPLV